VLEAAAAPRVIWQPTEASIADANLTRFLRWLREERGIVFADYTELWE
jgi:acetoacetyl-CoA synthetase